MSERIIKCARCEKEFETEWSEDEANAEFKRRFGHDPVESDAVSVCEDCDRELLEWAKQTGLMGDDDQIKEPS